MNPICSFRSNRRMTDWSQEEESVFMDLVQKYTRDNVIEGTAQIDNFREVMMSRHLVWKEHCFYRSRSKKCFCQSNSHAVLSSEGIHVFRWRFLVWKTVISTIWIKQYLQLYFQVCLIYKYIFTIVSFI